MRKQQEKKKSLNFNISPSVITAMLIVGSFCCLYYFISHSEIHADEYKSIIKKNNKDCIQKTLKEDKVLRYQYKNFLYCVKNYHDYLAEKEAKKELERLRLRVSGLSKKD